MGLETVTYLPELTQTNPIGASDPKSEGDNHLRLIKKALLNTFGSFVGTASSPKSVTLTEDQINDASQKLANETIAGDKTHSGFLRTDDSTTSRAGFRIPTGVAPTSPAQGDIWATATDLIARIDGVSLSMISQRAVVTKHKTANTSRTDNTVADDDHLAGWTIAAATYYKITGYLKFRNADNGLDVRFAFQQSETSVTNGIAYQTTNEVNTVVSDQTPIQTVINLDLASTRFTGVHMMGHIEGHATLAITLDFQWAQLVTNATPTILYDGSWITLEKMT